MDTIDHFHKNVSEAYCCVFVFNYYLLLFFKPLQIEIEQVFLKNVLKSIPRFPMVF